MVGSVVLVMVEMSIGYLKGGGFLSGLLWAI
jgi:hypothetical protein